MSGIRNRFVIALAAVSLAAVGIVGNAGSPPAGALSNPVAPWLTLDRTIGSQPWAGGGISAFDIEGIAYLPLENQIVVADDSSDRIYFVDHATGALVRTIPQSAFSGALPLGAASPTAGIGRADAFRAVIYDPSADSLYVFSGNCCGAVGPYQPTAFRLKRDASNAFQVESYQPLPEGTDAVAGGVLPGHGLYIGRGTRIRHYAYQSNVVGADIQLTGTGTSILGMSFPDPSTMVVTNSANQIMTVSTATWTASGWTLDAGALGVLQARSLAIIGDEFIVADGSDTRPANDPLKYALFIAHFGEAPPLAALVSPTATTGPAPLGVWFINHSIGATAYSWDFGDTTGSTDASPAHIYDTPGVYVARLRVTGPAGAARTAIRITAAPTNGRTGGYTLDGFGGLHEFAAGTGAIPPRARNVSAWPGWDIARGVALRYDGTGGYTLDGFGGLHPFGIGTATLPPVTHDGPYWPGWDAARGLALTPNNQGGYIVDLSGGIHRFRIGSGALPPRVNGSPYWSGVDYARGISLLPDGTGGYVVDRLGGLHPFGVGSHAPPAMPTGVWVGNDRRPAQGVAALAGGAGGYVVEGTGVIHRFTGVKQAPAVTGAASWPNWDIARDIAVFAAT